MDDPLNPTLHHLLTLCRMDRTWARGEGVFLWDAAGRRFLDFYSQYGAVALGHNAPCVTQTAQQALAEGLPAMVQPYRASAAVALARELERLAPGELTRCVFTTSGAQTVETALKLVRAKSGRKVIVAAEGAFHGKTLGALALSGARQWADGFGPLPLGFEHVPYGDATALAKRLKENGPNIAALVLEPIQGEGGVILPPAGYLRQARELCTRHGVALVLDEIQTGLGRTGRLFACEHEDVAPDVLLVAKALGGGLFPLGACLASAAWWDDGFALRHSSTFANNNVACAVGLAALGALTSPGFCEAVAEQGAHLLARLERMAERYPRIVADARGRGLLCALELRAPDADDGYFLSFLHQQGLYAYAVAGVIGELASLLVLPTLGRAPVLRLAPPLTITREQLDWGLDGLESVLELLEDNAPDTIVRGLGALETKPAPATASQNGEPCPPGNQSLGMNFESVRPLWVASREAKPDGGRFAFIVHYTRPEDVPLTDPALGHYSRGELEAFCDFLAQTPPGIILRTPVIESALGRRTEGWLASVPLLPQEMARRGLRRTSESIRQVVGMAARLGARVVGLGAFTTPYSGRGRAVVGRGPSITTGSALTAGMAVAALERAIEERGLDVRGCALAVVGALGSVGRLCARLLSRRRPRHLLLVGNPARGVAGLERLGRQLEWRPGAVGVTTEAARLAEVDAVLSASGAMEPVLDAVAFRPGAVVCDVARPPDSVRLRQRPDVTVVEGGLVALPDPNLRFGAGNILGLPDGIQLACFAETILLSLEATTRDHGIGDDVPVEEVDAMMALAARHGFRPAPLLVRKPSAQAAQGVYLAGGARLRDLSVAAPIP